MQEKNRDFSVIKERIIQYIEYKGDNRAQFYKKSGVTNGILSQSNGVTEDTLMKFLNFYTDINLEWLFFGTGEKEKNSTPTIKITDANEYLIDRLECLAKKNGELEKELKQYKEFTRGNYTMQDVPALKVAEGK